MRVATGIVVLCLSVGCFEAQPPATSTVAPDAAIQPASAKASAAPCTEEAQRLRGAVLPRHHRATRAKDTSSNEDIAAQYRAYLAAGAGCKEAPQMRFYLAELLWSTAEATQDARAGALAWAHAATAFSDALNRGGLDAKTQKEAAYAAILAWKNAQGLDVVATHASGTKAAGAQPLPYRVRKMLGAFDDYERVSRDPNDPQLAMIRFLRARIHWQHNQLARAVPLLESVVTQHAGHDVGEFAANLLLDSLNRLGKPTRLEHWVTKMLGDPALVNGRTELQRRLFTLRQQILRKVAEGYASRGKYVACATTYLSIHRTSPTAPDGDQVLYNAGVCFDQAGRRTQAITALQDLLSQFPASRLVPAARKRITALHHAGTP